jgi:hypothetical protein
VLFFSELRTFLTTEKVEAMEVDDAAAGGWRAGKEVTGKSMRINFDISFPATPCGMLSLDAMDASGAASVDVIHNVFKRRLDAAGYPIGEGQKAGDLGAVRSMEELVREKKRAIAEGRPVARVAEGACGDCYGAGAEGQCCNTCEEVRDVYRKKGWQLQMKGVTQCEQEGFYGDVTAQLGAREGCNAYGSLEVPKVPGSFHFGPSQSMQNTYQHVSDLIAFTYGAFNISHRVNALSFGPYVAADVGGKGVAPLDGRSVLLPAGTGMHQYFAKLVPLVYAPLSGQSVLSYQFSVTEHLRKLDHGQAQVEAA